MLDESRARPVKPRVLMLTSTFPRRREDTEPAFVLDLARRLLDRYAVLVLAPHGPGMTTQENLFGVEVVRFRYFFPRWERLAYEGGILAALKTRRWTVLLLPFFVCAQFLAAVRLLRRRPIALIHAHWLLPQGVLALAARFFSGRRVPALATSHGGDLYALRDPCSMAMKRWVLRRLDALTVVSQAMRNTVAELGCRAPLPAVIPMGVDLERTFTPALEPRADGPPVILFVGRLVEKKGLRVLLQALAEMASSPTGKAEQPPWQLHVVGEGPLRSELERLAVGLGLAARVRFWGGLENRRLPDFYRRAAMAVFPFVVGTDGDREGFGLVAVEALGCGCPVIAGDVPAVRDIITDEHTGLLVPPGNAVALAEAIRRLLADPELGKRLARAGRDQVRARFDWSPIAARYQGLYRRLLDRRSGPSAGLDSRN